MSSPGTHFRSMTSPGTVFKPQYCTTKKGAKQIIFDGYYFRLRSKSSKKLFETWSCICNGRLNCKAKIRILGNDGMGEVIINRHNHSRDSTSEETTEPLKISKVESLPLESFIKIEDDNSDDLNASLE